MKRILNTILFLYAALTMVAQNSFVIADKNGNSQFVQSLIFQQQQNADRFTWNADGTNTGDIKDLLFIARAQTQLATASSNDIIEMLEELSGTDLADAEGIAAALKNNVNVEEAYSADGENVVVKIKGDDSYAACPLYSLESFFSGEGEMEILSYIANARKKLRAPTSSTDNDKVAIFNFFEGGFSTHGSPYETKHIFAQLLCEMFEESLYDVEMYGHGFDNGGTPTFTMSKLDEVIEHSSDYYAIIIMSHGYTTSDGESYFATCEPYKNGASNPSNQTVIIDNNRFLAHSSKMNLSPNCLLYLGSCYGIPDQGYGSSSTSVIGWKGKNSISQIHAGVFFHKLLYSDGWVGPEDALLSSFRADPFNPSASLYSSPSVKDWGFIFNKAVQKEYAKGMVLTIGSGKDIFVKKTGRSCKFDISGYIKGDADDYRTFVKVKLEPIVRIQNPGEYISHEPLVHPAPLSGLAGGNGNYFEDSYTIDDGFLEGVYRINVYVCTQSGWKLLIQPMPVYVIYSSKLDDNYALPEVSDEDVYTPTILDSSAQPVTEITLPAGTSKTFEIDAYSGHELFTPCLDENVCTVSLSGTTLTVTGVSEGSTYFGVYDKENRQMAVAQVTVTEGAINTPAEAIDLGLPSGTLWASWNLGATKPEETGDYYAWGETNRKEIYDLNTYQNWNDANGDGRLQSGELSSPSIIAGTKYDAATVNWGAEWYTPTYKQVEELLNNTTSEWVTENGVDGRRFTSNTNGNSIFLPVTGFRQGSSLRYTNLGGYWSSTESNADYCGANYLVFGESYAYCSGDSPYRGYIIRPVKGSSLPDYSKERDELVKLYNSTNGDSWTHNDNWCSSKSPAQWYGITYDKYNEHVEYIKLANNNLTGSISIKGFEKLRNIDIKGNNISSLTIDSCLTLDLGYGFRLDDITLDFLHINNCFYDFGQHFIENANIKKILFTNFQKCGRIFLQGVVSDEVVIKDCVFDGQGVGVEDNSAVKTMTVENTTIIDGRLGGDVDDLVIKNCTIGDWWVIRAKSSITIINSYIEGHLVNCSGTSDEVNQYVYSVIH